MFAIRIHYLRSQVVATDPAHRDRVEWPPHPDRVFMALVAAHKQTTPDLADERDALHWLEQQDPPHITCEQPHSDQHRTCVTAYVPVNDTPGPSKSFAKKYDSQSDPIKREKLLKANQGILPAFRTRQPRSFPSLALSIPDAHLQWPDTDPEPRLRRALEKLCDKITYIGHSSCLVSCTVVDSPPSATLMPDDDNLAPDRLRVPTDGRLIQLEHRYQAGLRPEPGRWQAYRPTATSNDAAHGIFDDDLIIRQLVPVERHRTLHVCNLLTLTRGLRRSLLSSIPDDLLEPVITGHPKDDRAGTPLEEPHMACLALPFIDHEYADGMIKGVAVALPVNCSSEVRAAIHVGLKQLETEAPLNLGRTGAWRLITPSWSGSPRTLRPAMWCRPSTVFHSVSPIVLDRFPKRDGDEERAIRLACQHVGLPEPYQVFADRSTPLRGVPLANRFVALTNGRGPRRWHCHATIVWDRPVSGPVLLGAGRYRGYGLCMPATDYTGRTD